MVSVEVPRITQTEDKTRWSSGEFLRPDIENGLILEIGANYWPVFTWSEATLEKLRSGFVYFNIDNYEQHSGKVKRTGLGEDILGDLKSLPIRAESVDEAWVSNVFGLHSRPTDKTREFLRELSRGLKTDGIAYIVEWYSPRNSIWLQSEEFEQYGLETEEIFTQEKLLEFIDKFGITQNVSKHLKPGSIPVNVIPFNSFVIVIKKISK